MAMYINDFVNRDDTGAPVLVIEGEEVVRKVPHVEIAFDEEQRPGLGNLYVTTARIIWLPEDDRTKPGLAIHFRGLVLHAVSRDTSAYPRPCIYCQVAGTYAGGEDNGNGDGDGDGGVEEDAMTEVRLVPQDAGELEGLFESMCECAALHPDEEGAESGEEGDDVFFEAAAMRGATEEQRRAMERLGDMLGEGEGEGEGGADSNGQFEDAEEP